MASGPHLLAFMWIIIWVLTCSVLTLDIAVFLVFCSSWSPFEFKGCCCGVWVLIVDRGVPGKLNYME